MNSREVPKKSNPYQHLLPEGWKFTDEISPDRLTDLFSQIFDESPDQSRLSEADRFAVFDQTNHLVAGAAVERRPDRSAYLWLLAVKKTNRGQGVGKHLLMAIEAWCRREDCISLNLKTYYRWSEMRALISAQGWTMLAAELSGRNDSVGETWIKPLVTSPLEIIVIGGSSSGRGEEWIQQILSLPECWNLRGVVDLNPGVRAHWDKLGVPTYPDVDSVKLPKTVVAAVVAVPPGAAFTVQKSCYSHGWAVLVEKPLAASLGELLALQEFLTQASARLVAGVQRRSHPSYVALKGILADQEIREISVWLELGKSRQDAASGHRADPAQCRGGALIDLGYHALDLVHYLVDEPLEMLSCSLTNAGDLASGLESGADVLARAGQAWVRVHVSRHGAKSEKVLVATTAGIWSADRDGVRHPDGSLVYSCPGSWDSAEKGRLGELAAACLGSRLPDNDIWDHLSAFETIERAYSIAGHLGLKERTG